MHARLPRLGFSDVDNESARFSSTKLVQLYLEVLDK